MSELRAAAEDTLRESAGLLLQEFGFHSSGTARRACMLAESYLAEHPADDAEPVTEEWLLSVGFKRAEDDPVILVLPSTDTGRAMTYVTIEPCELRLEADDGGSIWIGERTRGDVRRLCTALGIELKAGE